MGVHKRIFKILRRDLKKLSFSYNDINKDMKRNFRMKYVVLDHFKIGYVDNFVNQLNW